MKTAAVRRWAAWVVLAALGGVAILSLLPLIETDTWWIRYLDFPRLQFAIALVGLLGLYLLLRSGIGRAGGVVVVLALAALGYHATKLWPYLGPGTTRVAADMPECDAAARFSVMAANVQKKNHRTDAFLDIVARAEPDVLLVLETDAYWDEALAPLDAEYPHAMQHIPEEMAFYGMHVYSKLPLRDAEFAFDFGAATPSFRGDLALENGRSVRLFGVHPQPPHVSGQPSTMRDAHLLKAALDMEDLAMPAVMAGDLNAVPWERTTRRVARLGGLLDPREGRGYYPTFAADQPGLSWPLDHVLWQDPLALVAYEVLPAFGSDHYPVMATLCLSDAPVPGNLTPQPWPDDRREALTSIRAARRMAQEDGV